MQLKKVRVERFQNVVDSSWVDIEADVTCLVGKNESGKTAFLQALYRLNPGHPRSFNPRDDYPRWRWRRDERAGTVSDTTPISVLFELDEGEVAEVEQLYGVKVLTSRNFTLSRTYDNQFSVNLDVDEEAVVKHFVERLPAQSPKRAAARATRTLQAFLEELDTGAPAEEDDDEEDSQVATVVSEVQEIIDKHGSLISAIGNHLLGKVPRLFYFGSYSQLPGRFSLTKLIGTEETELTDAERTALALLRLAGREAEELTDEDYEHRVAELEASANEITAQVLEYWTQNRDVRVSLEVDKRIEEVNPGQQQVVERYLDVRLNDERHRFTTNFERRSSGFRWFFSFIAAFSEFEEQEEPVVVLLDEPALALHARAQEDFLRFIDERLAPHHQVIYTTHSPFMVQSSKLERVRVVEDRSSRDNPNAGASVSSDVLATDPDTLFPLQAALGYDIGQNLFVSPHNLVIEGTSDLTYLRTVSDHLKSLDRTSLDERWKLVPVGGADKIPTFVALLGGQLEVTVLVDSQTKGVQRLTEFAKRGLLKSHRIVSVAQATDTNEADIEDLFTPGEYLNLYNSALGTSLKVSDIKGSDPILRRIERVAGKFDHVEPADVLLRRRDDLLSKLSDGTLDRFEKLFELLNATMLS